MLKSKISIRLIAVKAEDGEVFFNVITPEGGGRQLTMKCGEVLEIVSSARSPHIGIIDPE